MGTLFFMNQIKKQASCFLQEKYKTARLAFTDVTQAELLAEEATNTDPWGPDAKTMTLIAEASFDVDDYWRIVDVLHKRLESIDWKQWRQFYKSLVLLEFLITHGPEEFAEEFQCDSDVIEELGTFQYIDEKGFNWGENMQKRSDSIMKLLPGGDTLREARLNALRITKEIQGFGSYIGSSPTSSSSSSLAASDSSRASSFGSYSTASFAFGDDVGRIEQPTLAKDDQMHKYCQVGNIDEDVEVKETKTTASPTSNKGMTEGISHLWDCSKIQENGYLLDLEDDNLQEGKQQDGFINGICSKLVSNNLNNSPGLRSFSDVGKLIKKKYDRQLSIGYQQAVCGIH